MKKTMKYFVILITILVLSFVILFQFNYGKRLIVSYNHKREIPYYLKNIKIENPKSILILNPYSEAITTGQIFKNEIKQFYKDINGEQIQIGSTPIGNIDCLNDKNHKKFNIVYENNEKSMNNIYVTYNQDKKTYNIKMITSNN